MKKWILLPVFYLICHNGYSQNFGIKSNLLYDATSTINLGVEFALTDKLTLDVSGNFNPWSLPQKINSKGEVVEYAYIRHWMIQPEARWWFCEKFNGHFVGAHIHGGQFNMGGMSFLPAGWGDKGIQVKRYQGWLMGTGLSYGYHWIISSRLSLEFSLGAGYAFLRYDKYPKVASNKKEPNSFKMHYFGPTKAGISVIFMVF